MRNLFDKIRKTLIKWLGGYTEQTLEVVETKEIRLTDKDIITLECTQLFEAERFFHGERFQGFAKEATVQTLMAKLKDYVENNVPMATEYVPSTDSIRLKLIIKVVNSDW